MKNRLIILVASLVTATSSSQLCAQIESPYKTNLYKDGAWILGSLGLSAYGLSLVSNKDDLTVEELANLNENDIWKIDRWAAGNNSEYSSKTSDIPFFISYALPFAFVINKESRHLSGQLGVMYLESFATTAALFTITAGLVDKSRPLVYDANENLNTRLSNNNQRSFYSGHVAASATGTFFAAQVFSDLYPDSKAKPYIWAGAAIIPAVVGYYRIHAGKHFLTDTIIGYVMGAASGILVPRLHKRKSKNLKLGAGVGFYQSSINMKYVF